MKKTLNINIGNSIIHIEEDAYEILTVYLNEVKQHFSKNADDFEIVTDIENRIAEMFSEILTAQQKQVINIDDVAVVTAQMGSVKDFETSEESEESSSSYTKVPPYNGIKKLYRDTDQAMVAGVCAGLGHYLNVEARWIRLAALLTIFIGGSGILAYIIMWAFIPQPESKAEKMAMRGEAPNLQGFANSHLNPLVQQSRSFLAEFFDFLAKFVRGTGQAILKFIAIVIIIMGSFILLGLIGFLAGLMGFWDANIYYTFPLSMVNESYASALFLAVFVVFAIPLLALILFSVRVVFNSKATNKIFSFGLLIVWLIGVFFGIFYIAKISSEFKEKAEFAQVAEIKPHQSYTLNIDRSRFFTKEDSLSYQIDPGSYKGRRILEDRRGPFSMPKNMRLRIEKSEDGKTVLIQNYSARGKTFEAALKEAQNIHYDFLQKDSVLNFSHRVQLIKKANWRDQEVELLLKVPVGTHLFVGRDFEWYINGFDYWNCADANDSQNGVMEWIMTETGLQCAHQHQQEDKDQE